MGEVVATCEDCAGDVTLDSSDDPLMTVLCGDCWALRLASPSDLRAEIATLRQQLEEARANAERASEYAEAVNAQCDPLLRENATLREEVRRLGALLGEYADHAEDSGWFDLAGDIRRRAALSRLNTGEGTDG